MKAEKLKVVELKELCPVYFGQSLNDINPFLCDSLYEYCLFFKNEKKIVEFSEMFVSQGYTSKSEIKNKTPEDFINSYSLSFFNKMQEMIKDREEKLEDLEKSSVFVKGINKVASFFAKDEDKHKTDPNYVLESIKFLKTKTVEDVKNKFHFGVNYLNDDQDMIIPQDFKKIMSLNKLFLSVTCNNFFPKGVHTVEVSQKKYIFLGNNDKEMRLSFECKKDNTYIQISLELDDNGENYQFKTSQTYTEAHDTELLAIEKLEISMMEEKQELERDHEELKRKKDEAIINNENGIIRIENKNK